MPDGTRKEARAGTRLYLAGAYCARDALRDVADHLDAAGHTVTARWLQATHAIHSGTEGAAVDQSDGYAQTHVDEDFADIDAADVLVLFTAGFIAADLGVQGNLRAGGRHIETGYALAKGKPVIVVGEVENIFHRGACLVVDDVEGLLDALSTLGGWEYDECSSCHTRPALSGLVTCGECLSAQAAAQP